MARRPSAGNQVSSFLPVHPIEFAILSVLAEGVRHGYDVIKQIDTLVGSVQPADLYRRMRRLRAAGLITEAPAPRPAIKDDRDRRFFRLTALGWTVARAEAARLQAQIARTRRRTPLLKLVVGKESS